MRSPNYTRQSVPSSATSSIPPIHKSINPALWSQNALRTRKRQRYSELRLLVILSSLARRLSMAENLLQTALDLAPGQQDAPTTALTLEANISAQAHHQPIIAAT